MLANAKENEDCPTCQGNPWYPYKDGNDYAKAFGYGLYSWCATGLIGHKICEYKEKLYGNVHRA